MGNQTANPGRNSQPIVRHPLFPAIVALWFAALFGLGSMAVRASLLESLVISSHLDLIVPQAAPPLGVTARVLVAAVMAIVGGLIGLFLARRLARPKPVARERRRGAAPLEVSRPVSRYAAPDPLPDAETESEEQTVASGRRGALVAAGHEHRDFTPHEAAPLPGGQPQILDVTEFEFAGINQAEPEAQALPETSPPMELDAFTALEPETPKAWEPAAESAAVADADFVPAPQVARTFDAPAEPARAFDAPRAEPVQSQAFAPPVAEPVQPQAFEPALAESDPIEPEPATFAPASFARPFEAPQPVESAPADPQDFESAAQPARFDAPLEAPVSFARTFAAPLHASTGFAQNEPAAWQPGAAFAAPAAETVEHAQDGDVPAEPVDVAPAPGQAEPDTAPLHLPRLLSANPASSPDVAGAAEQLAEESDDDPMAALRNRKAPLPSFDDVAEPEVEYFPAQASQTHVDETAGTVAGVELHLPQEGAAAQRLTSADLAELSPVELIERLALSLQRRRNAAPAGLRAALASGSAFSSPAAEFAPWPSAVTPPVTPPQDAPVEVEAIEVAAPEAAPVPEAQPAPEPETAMSRLTLPAALRPIDFSEYEHDDDQPVFVPARSISMPLPPEADGAMDAMPDYFASQAASEAVAEPAAPQVAAAPGFELLSTPAEDNAEDSEDDVLAAGYSSLLEMSKPVEQRQQFVRIEDPEADTEAVEPVVIFPGQAMRAGTQFAAPAPGPVVASAAPPPSLAENSGQLRRFDAPAKADPDETERALRSALATLQRMSGAA